MKKENITFATKSLNGIITSIGRSSIYTPPISFKGGEINWFEFKTFKKRKLNTGIVKLVDLHGSTPCSPISCKKITKNIIIEKENDT